MGQPRRFESARNPLNHGPQFYVTTCFITTETHSNQQLLEISAYKIKRVISPSQLLFDLFLLWLIRLYQQRISPRKGWRCAYSSLHGGTGCSGFVREAIERYGHKEAFSLARARFQDCKRASQTLRLQQQPPFDTPDKKQERQPNKTTSPGIADCATVPDCTPCCWAADATSSCAPHHLAACDAGACHMAACDAGACDVGLGACDCFACW